MPTNSNPECSMYFYGVHLLEISNVLIELELPKKNIIIKNNHQGTKIGLKKF